MADVEELANLYGGDALIGQHETLPIEVSVSRVSEGEDSGMDDMEMKEAKSYDRVETDYYRTAMEYEEPEADGILHVTHASPSMEILNDALQKVEQTNQALEARNWSVAQVWAWLQNRSYGNDLYESDWRQVDGQRLQTMTEKQISQLSPEHCKLDLLRDIDTLFQREATKVQIHRGGDAYVSMGDLEQQNGSQNVSKMRLSLSSRGVSPRSGREYYRSSIDGSKECCAKCGICRCLCTDICCAFFFALIILILLGGAFAAYWIWVR